MSKARDLASAAPAPAGVTSTELGYVDGVTSAIQTQINTKSAIADDSAAGKNKIINSAMQVWQRGTTALAAATSSTTGFTADRWQLYRGGYTANFTGSRQLTADTINLPNIQYGLRLQRTAGDTSVQFIRIVQTLETANSIPLAGKTVTLSFYAKKGANFSQSTSTLSVIVDYGTGTDQNYITGFTGNTSLGSSNPTLTTTYQRFTTSFTIPTTATQLAVVIGYTPVGTAGANDWFEITGVQLEASSVASAFSTNGATLQAELAACQRYYYRISPVSTQKSFNLGQAYSTTNALGLIPFPVEMRTSPTALEQTGTAANYGLSTSNLTFNDCTAVPVFNNASVSMATVLFVATGLVAGNATHCNAKNNAAYLGWSAEL